MYPDTKKSSFPYISILLKKKTSTVIEESLHPVQNVSQKDTKKKKENKIKEIILWFETLSIFD